MDSLKTLIVIPCYQEASRLDPGKFTEFLQSNDDVGFVFVDDGSTDGTADVIEDAVNRHPRRIAGLRNETNMGKGESVRRGVLYAADKAACIGYWDADLATPFGMLWQKVHDEVDPAREGSIVFEMNDVAILLGFPEFVEQ